MKRVSARARRVASRLGSVGLVLLAAATALAFARPSARYATKPFARFTALRAASSADAFGRSGGVKVRLTLPGESLEFPLGVSDPARVRYTWVRLADSVAVGDSLPLGGALVRSPMLPGFYRLALVRDGSEQEVLPEPVLGVMVPFTEKRGATLNGYRIGTYLSERIGIASDRPEGFLPVGQGELELRVSTHLRLSDFLSHDEQQRDVWPKYVALSPRLLDKLELVVLEVERLRGARRGRDLALDVHSGFRTPAHNGRVRSAARDSRHQYGDAADVVMDANGDGRITASDGTLVARAVDAVERANPDLAGGLGLYTSARFRRPYVHIDARGTRSRWRG